jgi:hypothetical protein
MSAYNETNFNKMLEAFTELKLERDSLIMVINNLAAHMVTKYNYTDEDVAKAVNGEPLEEVITIQP